MAETLFDNGKGDGAAEAGETRQLRELSDGDRSTGAFVVRERERRQKRNGEDFLRLDPRGPHRHPAGRRLGGRAECFEVASPGAAVRVAGPLRGKPRYGPQLTLEDGHGRRGRRVRRRADLTDGPAARRRPDGGGPAQLIETVRNPHLRALLDRSSATRLEIWQRFRAAPAAKFYHQAYSTGCSSTRSRSARR